MQTFLPYPDFGLSAYVLDYRRLGKQRVEAYQILRTLLAISTGWKNHPATNMWRGYEGSLAEYGMIVCSEWIGRGYKDTLKPKFAELYDEYKLDLHVYPDWLGDEAFHLSHQSNLTRKDPDHYGQFWDVPNDLPYIWPKGKNEPR